MLVFPVCSHSNGGHYILVCLFEKGCDTVGADFTSIHQTTTTNINDITTFMRLLKLDKLHLSSEIKTFEALCSYKTNTDLSFRSCTVISIEYYFMSRPQPIYTTTTITLSYYMHLPLLSMFPVAIVHRPTLVRTKDDYEASRVCFFANQAATRKSDKTLIGVYTTQSSTNYLTVKFMVFGKSLIYARIK